MHVSHHKAGALSRRAFRVHASAKDLLSFEDDILKCVLGNASLNVLALNKA